MAGKKSTSKSRRSARRKASRPAKRPSPATRRKGKAAYKAGVLAGEKTNCKNRVSAAIRMKAAELGFNVGMVKADKLAKQACTLPIKGRW